MRFSGIAEVEYKWDAAKRQHLLIEINPRPWDQHRLGNSCGVNLMHLAYAERAGLAVPPVSKRSSERLWIAEDALMVTALTWLWKGNRKLASLPGLLRGQRSYAIWSLRDPAPLLAFLAGKFVPGLIAAAAKSVWGRFRGKMRRQAILGGVYEKGQSHN
jgi:predicted ATP-grasp superfamily ATP-dependent carboligase